MTSDPGEIGIRAATAADAPTLIRLMDDLIAWLAAKGRSGQWGHDPMSADPGALERVRALIEAGAVTLAERGGCVVGGLVLGPEPPGYVPATLVPPGSLYLHQVATARGESGRGVGALLMRQAVDAARDAGHPAIALDHWAGSPQLSDLYERQGYRRMGEFDIEQRGEPWPRRGAGTDSRGRRRAGRAGRRRCCTRSGADQQRAGSFEDMG